ncbi:hypothetical protein EVAR_97136_1 [Eumeta japonica]|uniref:Uncharacterized protein n=1 Tax=Eumeta variegata TaxID=151549 RepID=A0A4C1WRF2_EUMVA|nr:hypothetical protein EVAR_97136_1 [Eumeta japonica]
MELIPPGPYLSLLCLAPDLGAYPDGPDLGIYPDGPDSGAYPDPDFNATQDFDHGLALSAGARPVLEFQVNPYNGVGATDTRLRTDGRTYITLIEQAMPPRFAIPRHRQLRQDPFILLKLITQLRVQAVLLAASCRQIAGQIRDGMY